VYRRRKGYLVPSFGRSAVVEGAVTPVATVVGCTGVRARTSDVTYFAALVALSTRVSGVASSSSGSGSVRAVAGLEAEK